MKTDILNVAKLVASTVWSGRDFDEAEKSAVEEVAEALEFDIAKFSKAVDSEVQAIKNYSAEEIDKYIIDAAEGVDEEDAEIVLEAALQVIISDNVVAYSEVSTMLSIAEALYIEQETAIMLLIVLLRQNLNSNLNFNEKQLNYGKQSQSLWKGSKPYCIRNNACLHVDVSTSNHCRFKESIP